MLNNLTLGDVLHQCALRYGDRPFLTIAESGETYCYRDLEILSNRFAHGFVEQFSSHVNYAAIYLENGVEYLAASYALKKVDCVEVSVNRAMIGAPLIRMINQTQASVVITSSAHFDALHEIRDQIPHVNTLVVINGVELAKKKFAHLRIIAFDELLSEKCSHIKSAANDTDLAAILFTSGTTGTSKGCMLSHRYALRTAQNMIEPFRVSEDDCVYSPYPLSHIGPAYYDVLTAMITGGRVVLRERFSVSNFWPEVKKYGVTWFMMLGSVQQLLWAHPQCDEEKEHQVTRCWGTPAPVPKAQFDKRFNLHLIPGGGYGSTDAGWVVVPQWDHPGGVVLPHFEVAIHDDNDNPVPVGQAGEMVIRPLEPGVMSDGYFGMPERTLESRRNLWFHTGDIGRLDDDGLFYFMHRMSERIRVRGEMVSAYEVEEVILTHSAVQDCAVIGVQSEFGEEDVKAFVVAKPGHEISADELITFCIARMAKFMVPRSIELLDKMPLTPTGKPEKGRLAAMNSVCD